jgi:hypothetical protein
LIAFQHGALQHRGEPLLAGILAYGVLEVDVLAQVATFLAAAERLTVEEWLEILGRAGAVADGGDGRAVFGSPLPRVSHDPA